MTEWLLILATIILSGFFSGTEIAYVSANKLRLEIRSRKNSLTARTLSYFIKNPESFLSTTLVGNNIVNVLYATLMTLALTQPVQQLYVRVVGNPPSDIVMLILQTLIASILILFLGEIIPKVLSRTFSDVVLRLVVVPLRLFSFLFYPLVVLANWSASGIIRLFQADAQPVQEFFRRSDIELLIREMADEGNGDLDRDDSEILSNVLEMSNIRVKESMVPRTDIIALEKEATIEDALKTFIDSGFSKLPVYDDSIDNIVGVVFAYDLFKEPKTLSEIIRPIKHVPFSQKSKDLLAEFRKQNISMAIVIDEYGGTAGLVTIEDLLEEVVGDIQDEYDEEETILKKLADNLWLISGNVEIDDLNEAYPELAIPDDDTDYETIAGYITHESGRIPRLHDEVVVGRHKFTITKATHSRIEIVKLQLLD